MKKRVLHFAIVIMVLAIGTVAFAVPTNQVTRVQFNQTFTGFCCFTWVESVTINEPRALVPVVVTLSTDYRATTPALAGISVNGHECLTTAHLNEYVPSDGSFASYTFQWVVAPGDGLMKGNNTFTLCGGMDAGGSITLGFNTLAVRMSK